MDILVLGGGGREHALVWKLRQSPQAGRIWCAPGNTGIAAEPSVECVPWDGKDIAAAVALAERLKPGLTVVGPEAPLSLGVVDEFKARGWPIFGPTKAAARLESSKAFAKEFMRRNNIPTAHYAVCADTKELKDALSHFSHRVVVKADGLAAGKGVVIADSPQQAREVAEEMLAGHTLGQAGATVVLEEFLEGEEISFLVLCDGDHAAPLAPAQDHKRVGEGDTGPNTGGMGAYSTDTLMDDEMRHWLVHHVVEPTLRGMKDEGAEYHGILYCGLMMTARGPQVLEFNCRFGDPETQPILMRLESDLIDAFMASVEGRVTEGMLRWAPDAAACVVLASGGYPGEYKTGVSITGLAEAAKLTGVKVFHAGTQAQSGATVTAGGRVLGVTARGEDLINALNRAYHAVGQIGFEGMHYRRDIGARALKA